MGSPPNGNIHVYTHYELEGYEIEGSVLKKCHLNRVASVRFEKFKGCPSTGL